MPSTYSPNLGLELPALSEQSGTWGTTVNTNVGTLIEQSISGYVTQAITDGADTTITIPNGATGVARNMTLELTGALTAARNLVVPANKKLYFVFNNTTGGFAVTVKVSGQTGISVPNGKRMVLVSNGTDVSEAVTYLSTVTTFAGPVSATDNALTRFNGTTGALVQNSSATLDDSGNLTATSFIGVGTSLTLLNASSLGSGTVPLARLPATVALLDGTNVIFSGLLRYGPSGGTAYETGFRDIPRVAATGSGFTITATHRGCYIDSAGYGNVVMGTNAENGMALGSAVAVYNNSNGSMTISSSDTLRLVGTGSSGTRTLAQRGWATLVKVATTEWVVMGPGVT